MGTTVARALQSVLFVGLLITPLRPTSAQALRSPEVIAAEITRYMEAAQRFEQFSGAILVARDGRPIISRAYGLANVEHDVPNTPQTVYRLGSLTTQFTAVAIMMLQEQGKLNVNDPFCRYLADCPPAWQPITIRQLLTMTSGIVGVHGVALGPLRGFPIPWDQLLEALRKQPLAFAPGSAFLFDYPGYYLAGFLIEKLSGQSYGDFLDTHIFRPLGMTRSGYENPLRIIKNRATGYRHTPYDPISNVPYIEVIRVFAGGGVYGTTEDLLRWDQALYTERLLSRKSIDDMHQPAQEMFPGKAFASGVWVSEKHGRREIANGGHLPGFITYMARYPEDRVTVIVLSNNERGSAGRIGSALSSIVFGSRYELPYERKAVTVDASRLSRYVGEYHFPRPNVVMTVTNENGRLFLKRGTEAKVEMFPESDSTFFLKVEDVQFTFATDASGTVTAMTLHQGDSTRFEVITGTRAPRQG
jgi:CubicO group peptidase (beta-lactamase class C family)